MKTWPYIFGILLLFAGISPAQTIMGLNLYGGGGLTAPFADVEDSWKVGGHGSVAFGYPLTAGLEGAGRYSYHSFPLGDNPDSVSFADVNDHLIIHEFAGEVRAQLTPPGLKIRPYGIIGAGLAGLPDRTEFFYCVGGGFKFSAAPNIDFFIEGRYSLISVEDYSVSYVPVTIGIHIAI